VPADVSGPLKGIRVLDFTALVQGPMATQMLGDLGADIVKIEKVGGEWMRFWGILNGKTFGEMDSFLAFNRNKRSAEADLRDPEVVAKILELARDADVLVENFRPGVMARLGLSYEDVRKVNPRIIYASSSGYGQSGPYVKRPGQDMLIQALSGVMFLTGRSDDPPTALGVGLTDQYTALHIVIGVLSALHHRERTGEGQKVEVDLFSCTVAMQQQELTFYRNQGFLPPRADENLGSVWATAPFGIYATSDGHIAIAMTPCPVLAEALDQPWLAEYDTNEKMVESRPRIYAGLAEIFETNTRAHWIEVLLGHDVWCAPVQSYEELIVDPQVEHNRMFWEVPVGDDEGTFTTPGSPITFSATPPGIRHGVPRAGQHTEEILADSSPWDE
jgi:crotonobetainyl-CoA:carnitine CoA-transferase CaiB-like acyl-CoA transferase